MEGIFLLQIKKTGSFMHSTGPGLRFEKNLCKPMVLVKV